jgi:hypothetical protein
MRTNKYIWFKPSSSKFLVQTLSDNVTSLKELGLKSNILLEGYFNLGYIDWSIPLILHDIPDQ